MSASDKLLSAALGGLLCAACSSSKPLEPPIDSGGADVPIAESDAAPTCDGGVVADAGVTSSSVVPNMTLESFTAQCQGLNGAVEILPHCGGSNSCRGMSYDTGTQVLTYHTCRGTNTCAGYSCVIC